MHRQPLFELIDAYEAAHPDESPCVERVRELVRSHSDCFLRSCLPGHITASSWIVSPDHSRFLLTHHRKLGRWLQLGGHADGDNDVQRVALAEAREESGMKSFELQLSRAGGALLDLDVHRIPARPGEPAHDHHDLRFLWVAGAGQSLVMSDESTDLRWFDWSELESIAPDESLLRLGRKARDALGL